MSAAKAVGARAITLVGLAEQDRGAFVQEEVANYAQQQIRDAGWPRAEALDRARAALLPVLERELAEAAQQGHALWSAVTAEGVAVGWLWVRPSGTRARGAFLYQLTVATAFRRMGYGRAMLAALEARLARDSIEELCLHVNAGNLPLAADGGTLDRLAGRRRLPAGALPRHRPQPPVVVGEGRRGQPTPAADTWPCPPRPCLGRGLTVVAWPMLRPSGLITVSDRCLQPSGTFPARCLGPCRKNDRPDRSRHLRHAPRRADGPARPEPTGENSGTQ